MLRDFLRTKIKKTTRRSCIALFVKHRYLYNQGTNILASTAVFDLSNLMIILAGIKFIISGGWKENIWYFILGFCFILGRLILRWSLGNFWHRNDGYDVETEWNKDKVPPSRVQVINADDLIKRFIKLTNEENSK